MANDCCVCCGEIIPEGRQVCPACQRRRGKQPSLNSLRPLSNVEKEMVARLTTEDEAVMAILKRRTFLKESNEHIGSLCKEQYRARFSYRNEKETATMPILYEEDV